MKQIKKFRTEEVLHEHGKTVKECAEHAVENRAKLNGAELNWAKLIHVVVHPDGALDRLVNLAARNEILGLQEALERVAPRDGCEVGLEAGARPDATLAPRNGEALPPIAHQVHVTQKLERIRAPIAMAQHMDGVVEAVSHGSPRRAWQ